jgi:GTP-dependent phosphoenolpyruvate carboxykinase
VKNISNRISEHLLKFRCRKSKATTQKTDKNSLATTSPSEESFTNVALDEDGLVSATKQRTPVVKDKTESSQVLDPKLEEMLDNAYADARQFAKFPHMP